MSIHDRRGRGGNKRTGDQWTGEERREGRRREEINRLRLSSEMEEEEESSFKAVIEI